MPLTLSTRQHQWCHQHTRTTSLWDNLTVSDQSEVSQQGRTSPLQVDPPKLCLQWKGSHHNLVSHIGLELHVCWIKGVLEEGTKD